MSEQFENRNDKQLYFNQIKGEILEFNDGDRFGNITLKVGHEKPRDVNVALKKQLFEKIVSEFKIGDKVNVKFYLTSKHKNNHWYTMANVLEVTKDNV